MQPAASLLDDVDGICTGPPSVQNGMAYRERCALVSRPGRAVAAPGHEIDRPARPGQLEPKLIHHHMRFAFMADPTLMHSTSPVGVHHEDQQDSCTAPSSCNGCSYNTATIFELNSRSAARNLTVAQHAFTHSSALCALFCSKVKRR